ncbi:MAG TPA: sigma 54-interacting transcriptional regulator [Kofleriaceae bacterium]|nr:sigma 54-interacting transcriptional regulator [Kofleriaceae bacterium]
MPSSSDLQPTDAVQSRTFERALRDGFRVTVVDGPDAGATALSAGTTLTLGTDPRCDLALRCRATSRFHCEIELGDDGAMIRDLGSTNGTRVDGVRVVIGYLRRGAEVELGRNRLRFDLATEPVGVELYPGDRFGAMVGQSPVMRAVFARMARAAQTDTTVLLAGETGTGKDTAAEAIHAASARAQQPFVVLDCAALAAGVADSELFGHAAGAFTGADQDRAGVFEAAAGGTVFLDEIGELPLALQPKLLRALERREIQRVGESRPRPIAARVIAATHRDLRRDVNTGRFRADLYFRVAVMQIQLPPLRERRDDLPLLIEALLAELVSEPAVRDRLRGQIQPASLARMEWPGNLRELRNAIERYLVVEHGATADLPDATLPYSVAREAWQRWFDRHYLTDLLQRHGGRVAAAARHAGMHRGHLYRLLQRAGLP